MRARLDNIPTKKPGDELAAAEFNKLVAAVRTALNVTGRRVIVDGSGTFTAGERPPRQVKTWPGRVIAIAELAPNQWVYDVNEVFKKSPGYGGWDIKPNGRQIQVFNKPEDQNSESGVQGTGIEVDNLPGDFAHQPVPVGSIVDVTEVRLTDGSGTTTEYWMDRMNGVDGRCTVARPGGPPPPA